MNYLSGALRYVAGGEADSSATSAAAVPRLLDRLKTSALPSDRRSAINALTLATKHSPARQALVGESAVKPIYAVLEQDADYDDTLKAALDLLIALCASLDPPDAAHLPHLLPDLPSDSSHQHLLAAFEQRSVRAAATNIDMFLGLPNAVSLLLALLQKDDFYIKFSTIELFTAMAANSRQTLQLAILEAPQGVARICDLLDDNHRLLRSNAVLLLSTLCDQSPEICKIVAYGGVLEKLFALVEALPGAAADPVPAYDDDDDDDDDSLEAAIVVQDVLYVLKNLITGAATTRTFFRDTGSLPRLVNVLKRAAAEASIIGERPAPSSSGRKIAVEKQARKNLIIAMHCIVGLTKHPDSESRLVKNDLATTNIFNILVGLAFSPAVAEPSADGKVLEKLLHVKVGALKTMALLARGHDEFRSMFSSSSLSLATDGDVTSVQVAALRAMLGDPSSAIRVAAYSALRESFVADAGLDLPSSNLLNAMTGSGGSAAYSVRDGSTGLRRNPLSSSDLPSPSNPVPFIAESLKAALVDWPSDTDAAGVFYAASLVTWVISRVQGARERLLASYVNGGPLLPQIIRVLGKLEREKGPPEVRIALFSLACTWLHGSPPAVSTFLSSAMHLPMLVDVLNGAGSRGDLAEVHVRGLAAVVLGICLQATDNAPDGAHDSGFLSGGEGASVIPRGTVADVIRNRIGITVFTSCLDDLRGSKAFSIEETAGGLWSFAEALTVTEDRSGFLSVGGSLGHEQWYSANVINVVNDVYKSVGAKVIDLIAEQAQVPGSAGNGVMSNAMMNGHVGDAHSDSEAHKALLADSARDEVLNSYKKFIRSQDESLNAARRQIEELATALRETQRELDARTDQASAVKESDRSRSTQKENEELLSQKEALEALLEEKAGDFAALSNAYASLEEEHTVQGSSESIDGNASAVAEISSLRSQNARLRESLNAEIAKTTELDHQAALVTETVKARDVELNALALERDMLKANAHPEVSEALEWRTRAEVAEANLSSRQSMLASLQSAKLSLEKRLLEVERSLDESDISVSSLEKKLEAAKDVLEEVQSTRRRELQVARESSHAGTAAAENEISVLKDQLAEARQKLADVRSLDRAPVPSDELKNYELLKSNHQSMISSFEQSKIELLDAKSAISQWQKRAETAESAREREVLENDRLSNIARDLDGQLRKVNEDFKSHSHISSARILELEQQNSEMDEMRRQAGEETKLLKEELATRMEQNIRLSGQLYETEEAKEKVEERLQGLENQLINAQTKLEGVQQESFDRESLQSQAKESPDGSLVKIAALEQELEATKDALADSRDKESLGEAHAREREAAVVKAASLEESLAQAHISEANLRSDLDETKQRLLSLDEAEAAKRALTMQVVALQKSLAEISPVNDGISTAASAKLLNAEDKVKHLHTQVIEKDMRLQGLESSLTTALDRADSLEKEKLDLQKQVTETEAMLSVLKSERDSLSANCDQLKVQLEAKPQFPEMNSSVLQELEEKLQESEKRRSAVSSELASLVDACRQAENESTKMRDESQDLREKIAEREIELARLRKETCDLSRTLEVDKVTSSAVLEAAIQALSDSNADALGVVRHERDTALSLQSQTTIEMDALKATLNELRSSLEERENSLAATSAESDELRKKLGEFECSWQEHEELARSFAASKVSIQELVSEKDMLEKRLHDATMSRDDDEVLKSEYSDTVSSTTTQKRVTELEDALRDAARTVSATNLELICAQALLVELSADKTMIRTELAATQEQIQKLTARLSIDSRSHANESILSEVSEPEQSVSGEITDVAIAHADHEMADQNLKAAHAEVENLRTMLKRSTAEAESAISLLATIDVKFEKVEQKLLESQTFLHDSRAEEKKLGLALNTLRKSFETEKQSLASNIDALKGEFSHFKILAEQESKKLTRQMKNLELAAKTEKEKMKATVLEMENQLDDLREEGTDLRSQLQDETIKVERLSASNKLLEEANYKYASTIVALEGTVSNVNKNLVVSENRQKDLQESLDISKEKLLRQEESFDCERRDLQAKQEKELEELESELQRASTALEDAERKFRDAEATLKNSIVGLEETIQVSSTEVEALEEKLKATSELLASTTAERSRLENKLAEEILEKKEAVSALAKERDNLLLVVKQTTSEKDTAAKTLFDTEELLRKTNAGFKEEREQKIMLEVENQDFLSTIESMETDSKRLRENVTKRETDLASVRKALDAAIETVNQQGDELVRAITKLEDSEDNARQLRESLNTAQDETEDLRVSLNGSEIARVAAERDNQDLKAWVADLERQATSLQSAAENFEEVEQSLREALEAHREIAEQNTDLTGELKKERELVASTGIQLRCAIREKKAAESARESSQRRTTDLEARIKEIRDEHLTKFSSSEDAIRIKAQRCAELETKLASVERQLAELATVSDSLFGARAELKQRDEDIKRLQMRAEAAEMRAEDLQSNVRIMESEMAEMRESANGDAYRSLEAEHNDLLVCLADLEMDCTRLKEELGRE